MLNENSEIQKKKDIFSTDSHVCSLLKSSVYCLLHACTYDARSFFFTKKLLRRIYKDRIYKCWNIGSFTNIKAAAWIIN